MRLSIKIDSDNVGCSTREDMATLVDKLATKIRRGDEGGKILDINGNSVGSWELEGEEEDECEEPEDVVDRWTEEDEQSYLQDLGEEP